MSAPELNWLDDADRLAAIKHDAMDAAQPWPPWPAAVAQGIVAKQVCTEGVPWLLERLEAAEKLRTDLLVLLERVKGHTRWESDPVEFRDIGGSWVDMTDAIEDILGLEHLA